MPKTTIPSKAPLTPRHFKDLNDQDTQLQNDVFQAASRTSDLADSSVVEAIVEHFALLKSAVATARKSCDVHTIAWIRDSVSAWQSMMTNILRIPYNVREKVGIQTEDSYLERVDAVDLLHRQAHQIATRRKLNRKLEEASYFLRYPERINTEIASSQQECEQDWHQSCLFLALDHLQGRLHTSILADSKITSVMNEVVFEDVVQLKAYLLWEASRVGFSPDQADHFYSTAFEQLVAFLNTKLPCDEFLIQLTLQRLSDWENSQNIRFDYSGSQFLLKKRWLEQRHGHSPEDANRIAKQQMGRFQNNIVSAIKGDEEAILQVKSAVIPSGEPQIAACSTVLECLIAARCL